MSSRSTAVIFQQDIYRNIPRNKIPRNHRKRVKNEKIRQTACDAMPRYSMFLTVLLLSNLAVTTAAPLLQPQDTRIAKVAHEREVATENLPLVRSRRSFYRGGYGYRGYRRGQAVGNLITSLSRLISTASDNFHCKTFLKLIQQFNADLSKPFAELNNVVGHSIKSLGKEFKDYTEEQKAWIINRTDEVILLAARFHNQTMEKVDILEDSFQDIQNQTLAKIERYEESVNELVDVGREEIGTLKNVSMQSFHELKESMNGVIIGALWGRAIYGVVGIVSGVLGTCLHIKVIRSLKATRKETRKTNQLLLEFRKEKAGVSTKTQSTQTEVIQSDTEEAEAQPLLQARITYKPRYSKLDRERLDGVALRRPAFVFKPKYRRSCSQISLRRC